MKTQHDDLKAVAPVRPFEEAWLDEVVGAARREVDASVRQAVAVEEKGQTGCKGMLEHQAFQENLDYNLLLLPAWYLTEGVFANEPLVEKHSTCDECTHPIP